MMERFSEILNIVLASGLISQFVFHKSKKRKQKAEADVSEFDAMKGQMKHFTEQLKEAYVEVDNMQSIIDNQRSRLVEISRALSEVRIQLVKEEEKRVIAEYNICTVVNCSNRMPPRNNSNSH